MSLAEQLPLLHDVARRQRPRKRVRAVSKHQYAVLRDTDKLSQGQHAVLTAIAAIYNRSQVWPTRAELATWMCEHGRLARPSVSLIAPRLTELCRGVKNRRTGEYHGGGVIEPLPVRPCRIAKTGAHPWRITEAGAKQVVGV